jgi:hypothetical protein
MCSNISPITEMRMEIQMKRGHILLGGEGPTDERDRRPINLKGNIYEIPDKMGEEAGPEANQTTFSD